MTLAAERKKVGRSPFQVVELELDQCRLTYGTSPCAAAIGTTGDDRCYNTRATCQDPNNYDRLAGKRFDTTADRLDKAAALSGVAGSKSGTLIALVRTDSDGTARNIIGSTSNKFEAQYNSSNKFRVKAENAAGTEILNLLSQNAILAASGWHLFMVSWNLAVAGSARMFDGDQNILALTGLTTTDDTIDYAGATSWTIGAFDSGSQPLDGGCHLLYFAPGQYTDWNLPYLRRRVLSRFGNLVNLGTAGANLTGTAPAIFMKGSATTFNTNNGTGGAFTANTNADYATLTPYLTGTKQTLRFCTPLAGLPKNLGAIPALNGVSTTPARLQPDRGIGERASVSATLRDAPHHDRGIDPYVSLRSYNPMTQGTLFTKLAARSPYYVGRTMRVLSGYLPDDPPTYDAANFETRSYLLDSLVGPDASGHVSITAKDALKLADDDKSVAPFPAKATLIAAVTSSATSFSIKPFGYGDLYYSRTGYVRINREVMRFKRDGDAFTVVDTDYTTASVNGRGRFNTTAAAQAADDSVQECYSLAADSGKNATELLYDWFVTYAGIDPNIIDKAGWDSEEASFMPSVFSGIVTEPVGVTTLVTELAQQAGFNVWWDERAGLVRLRALRPISSASIELTDARSFVADSVSVKEETERRISQCVVYFGQYDPTEPLEKRSNYRAIVARVSDSESAAKYGQSRIKELFSRWIPSTALATAQRVGDTLIQRFGEVPKSITFTLDAKDVGDVYLADLFVGKTRLITDAAGATDDLIYQALSASEVDAGHRYAYTALQERFTGSTDDGERVVYILDGEFNLNARTEHDKQYAAPIGGEVVRIVIIANSTLGSTSTGSPSLHIGSWPATTTVILEIQDSTTPGRIQGKGGAGGGAISNNGAVGGPALYTRKAITLAYANLLKIVAVDTTAETLEIGSHSYVADQQVKLLVASGTAPGGLSGGTTYYIKNPTATTVQLAASAGGAAINLTSAGSGIRYLHNLITAGTGGKLWSGSGGGASGAPNDGGGGGGGAGTQPGAGGDAFPSATDGQDGTDTAGGAGGAGGGGGESGSDGGGPGADGSDGAITVGGLGGSAIDGVSYVTVSGNTGDLLGYTIN